MWSELQSIFPSEFFSLSPQTPLQITGSHSSLQTGSSSSYHSAFAGIPVTEFADLRIFPTWTQPPSHSMANPVTDVGVLRKRKLEDSEEIVTAALTKTEKNIKELKVQDSTIPQRPGKMKIKGYVQDINSTCPYSTIKPKAEPHAQDISTTSSTNPSLEGKTL